MIVIVSKDKDFSHTLAEHIVRELEETCECVESQDELSSLANKEISLVVTTEKLKKEGYKEIAFTPPIRLREALLDIASSLRQPTRNELTEISGGLILNERMKELSSKMSSKSVNLTDKETQLLKALLDAGTKGVRKEELLKNVWGFEAELNTHTLETHIYRMRSKFKDISGSEMIEATENGYKLA